MLSAPTEFSDIPIEVVDRILNFLHDDSTALCSASLVSRGWVSATRHHLFGTTRVAEENTKTGSPKDNASLFLELAKSEHCTILPAIREIALLVITPTLIEDIVKVLTRLRAPAQLMYVHFTHSRPISWNASDLSTVHNFVFNSWSTFGAVDPFRLITSFPNLHTLSIFINYPTATVTLPSGISVSSLRNLRVLHLGLLATEELFNWLIQNNIDGSHFALETLGLQMLRRPLYHNGWGSVDALNLFLKEVSDTLIQLSLEMEYLFESGDSHLQNAKASRIDLNGLINLRSLSFRMHDINAVCTSLASLSPSSATLEVLHVHILRWHSTQIERCDCIYSTLMTKFTTVMEAKQLVGTKTLRIKIPHDMEVDLVVDLLHKWNQSAALELTNTDDTVE